MHQIPSLLRDNFNCVIIGVFFSFFLIFLPLYHQPYEASTTNTTVVSKNEFYSDEDDRAFTTYISYSLPFQSVEHWIGKK